MLKIKSYGPTEHIVYATDDHDSEVITVRTSLADAQAFIDQQSGYGWSARPSNY
jgi:hypothetical protein